MSINYLKTLERRADELEALLGENPHYAEWQALKVAIKAHKDGARADLATHESKAVTVRISKSLDHDLITTDQAGTVHVHEVKVALPEPRPSRGKQLVDAAISILRNERRYLNSGQLAQRLIDTGHDLSAKSTPQAYLSAHLSGSKLVENIKGHGYGLVEWRAPSAEASLGPQAERAH